MEGYSQGCVKDMFKARALHPRPSFFNGKTIKF